MKNGRLGILVIAALVVAAALLAVLGPRLVERRVEKPATVAGAPRPAGVTARGVVEAADDVLLESQVRGTVSRVLAEEGAEVKKGQLLLEVDAAKVQAQRLQAIAALSVADARFREASSGYRTEEVSMASAGRERALAVWERARDEYQRQQRLFDQGATTRVELDQARERMKVAQQELASAEADFSKHRTGMRRETVDQARADRERARADLVLVDSTLKDYRVYSPISGIVMERHKETGETVDPGTPLFRVADPASFRIRAELEETDIGRVSEGQPAEVTVEAFPNKVYRGKVAKVYPVVHKKKQKSFDPVASFDINTQKILVRLDDYTGLKDGMTTTVRFK